MQLAIIAVRKHLVHLLWNTSTFVLMVAFWSVQEDDEDVSLVNPNLKGEVESRFSFLCWCPSRSWFAICCHLVAGMAAAYLALLHWSKSPPVVTLAPRQINFLTFSCSLLSSSSHAFDAMVALTRSLPWVPHTWVSVTNPLQTPGAWFWGTNKWAISAALLSGRVSRIAGNVLVFCPLL